MKTTNGTATVPLVVSLAHHGQGGGRKIMADEAGFRTDVTDAATAQAVIVARLSRWAHANDYHGQLSEYLRRMGLAHLVGLGGSTVKVTVPALFDALTAELSPDQNAGTVILQSDQSNPTNGAVRDLLYNAIVVVRDRCYRTITRDMWEIIPPETGLIDEAAVIGTFGRRGDLVFTGDGETEARRIALLILEIAEARGDCPTVEEVMTRVGLGPFIPPRQITRIVTVPMVGDLTITIPCARNGEPDMSAVAARVQSAVAAHWAEQVKTMELREVPAAPEEQVTV